MLVRTSVKTPKNQQGIVLLMMAIVVVLASITFLLAKVSVDALQVDRQYKNAAVLKQAKQAFLAYSLTNSLINWETVGEAGKFGKLPCPDYMDNSPVTQEGQQDGNCGKAYANGIGFFPWRTLGIDVQKDSSGNCLIYAVSPAYKTSPAATLNPDSYGQLQTVDEAGAILQGAIPEERLVAVIIAPGKPLAGQARNNDADTICGFDYDNIAAYLDNDGITDNAALDPDNENVIDKLVQMYAGSEDGSAPLNDRLVTISYAEIWDPLLSTIKSNDFDNRMKYLTEALALCFAGYGLSNAKHLPMPTVLNLGGGEYRRDADYDDSGFFTADFAGRLPFDVENANTKLMNADFNHIFKNGYCNDLDVTTTSGTKTIRFSDNAGDDKGEYLDLWSNWKDHFFYAISEGYSPVATGACGNCISVDGISYAGIVFFSGLKLPGQKRYAPPFDGVDDKGDVINYLEENRGDLFPDNTGDGVYDTVDVDASNDIMFCITKDMSVTPC